MQTTTNKVQDWTRLRETVHELIVRIASMSGDSDGIGDITGPAIIAIQLSRKLNLFNPPLERSIYSRKGAKDFSGNPVNPEGREFGFLFQACREFPALHSTNIYRVHDPYDTNPERVGVADFVGTCIFDEPYSPAFPYPVGLELRQQVIDTLRTWERFLGERVEESKRMASAPAAADAEWSVELALCDWARIFGRHENTVRKWFKDQTVKAEQRGGEGTQWRVSLSALSTEQRKDYETARQSRPTI